MENRLRHHKEERKRTARSLETFRSKQTAKAKHNVQHGIMDDRFNTNTNTAHTVRTGLALTVKFGPATDESRFR